MLWLSSLAAYAGDLPTIAVVGLHQSEQDVDTEVAATQAIAARIDAGNAYDALNHVEITARIAGREGILVEEAVLGPGRRLLEDGRSMWSQAQPEEAIPLLDDAIAALQAAMATGVSSRDLWDAYMVKALAERDLNDEDAMRDAFERAIATAPTRNPDPATYPPDVVAAFDRLRSDVLSEAATVEIDASITGAAIRVDGEARGTAPVTLTDIAPGPHTIVASAPDGSRGSAVLEADPGAPATVRVLLGPPTLGVAATSSIGKSRQIGALYRTLGSRADVDFVLVAGVVDKELRLQLYSVRANAFSQPVVVPFEGSATDEATVAVPQVLAALEGGALPVDKTVANAIPIDISANPLVSRLLLAPGTLPGLTDEVPDDGPGWVLPVAAGVGALIVGGVVAGAALGSGDRGTITVTLP